MVSIENGVFVGERTSKRQQQDVSRLSDEIRRRFKRVMRSCRQSILAQGPLISVSVEASTQRRKPDVVNDRRAVAAKALREQTNMGVRSMDVLVEWGERGPTSKRVSLDANATVADLRRALPSVAEMTLRSLYGSGERLDDSVSIADLAAELGLDESATLTLTASQR